MIDQLSFSLPRKVLHNRENYFVSRANRNAVSLIEDWNSWPLNKLILVGSEGSGKTHLASLWAEEVGAKILSSTSIKGYRKDVTAKLHGGDVTRKMKLLKKQKEGKKKMKKIGNVEIPREAFYKFLSTSEE